MIDKEPSEEAKALATQTQDYYLGLIFDFMGEIENLWYREDGESADAEFIAGINEGIRQTRELFMETFKVEGL